MEKLDVKDRKILHQLTLNSRQSNSKIGKKVGLHKDVVTYRIKKLVERGVILNFHTVIDSKKIGYSVYRIYLTFQYMTEEIKEEIIEYFVKSKFTRFVYSSEGVHDLVLVFAAKDVYEFYQFWEKTLYKYNDFIANQEFSIYIKDYYIQDSYFIDEKAKRKNIEMYGKKRVDIDDLDYQILNLIATDSRIPTIEIAKKINLTTKTVQNRIKKMMNAGIIQEFNILIDYTKLGYKWFKVFITLKDYKKLSQIINYLKNYSGFHAIDKSLGYKYVGLQFYLKNTNQLHQIFGDLSKKIPEAIKNYTYHSFIKIHKYNYMPEE